MPIETKITSTDALAVQIAERVSGVGRSGNENLSTQNHIFDPASSAAIAAARGAITRANNLLDSVSLVFARAANGARKQQHVEVEPLTQVVDDLIANFDRCSNALLWALATNKRMRLLHRRSVGSAVLALVMGRFLGFERTRLNDLVLGALLLDIGMNIVPVTIRAKTGELSDSEQKFIRRHVDESVRILEKIEGLSPDVIEMVRSHHERIDGSGYPAGLEGLEIPLNAQIAGIVDSFDALSLSRYYAEGISGHDALGALNAERGLKFDSDLVDKFICAIGVFPTGTWIEFNDGAIGVVCLQNPREPMLPHVALITDADQQPLPAVRWLTLSNESVARAMRLDERPSYSAAMEQTLQTKVYGS